MSVATLSDLHPWRTITLERTDGPAGSAPVREIYTVWYTSNAIFKLERALDMGFEDFIQLFRESKTGFGMLQALLYAGLEGARLKMFPRAAEWTLESAGDLIDACGGHRIFWLDSDTAKILGQAVAASLPVSKPKADPAPAVGDAAPGGPATTAADPLRPAMEASTGAASSTGRRTAVSARKSSGT